MRFIIPNTMNTEIAKRIKERMLALDLKAVDLARGTGSSKATVSQWLHGDSAPRYSSIEKLGITLDCDPYWLATGEQMALGSSSEHRIDKIKVAERIKSRMDGFNLTMKELGGLTQSSPTTVGQWLRADVAPSIEKAEVLAEALQCSKEWLLFGLGEEPKSPEEILDLEPFPSLFHISDRIQHRVNYLGLRPVDVARAIDVGKASVSHWINGVSKPSSKYMSGLAKVLECSTEWLLTGRTTAIGVSHSPKIGVLSPWDENTEVLDSEVVVPLVTDKELMAYKRKGELDYEMIISRQLGEIRELRFSRSTMDKISVNPDQALCVKINIPAMEPFFPPDTTIGVDLGRTVIVDGKIFAFWHFDTFRVATLFLRPDGGIRIKNFDESRYPEEQISQSDLKDISIIGAIFWHSVVYEY